MGDTKIAWTDKSWNPVTGCTKISSGCDHCYAERFAERWRGIHGHAYENGFDLQLRPERLDQPGRWTKPSMIFVCSMADLFQSRVPYSYLDQVFDVMEAHQRHVFQVLTKRSRRARGYLTRRWRSRPPGHIWIGITAENQDWLDHRLPNLRRTPAAVRFVSVEPMLEPIGFDNLNGIDQVIVGGESGPGFRPMDADWVRGVRDQCKTSGTAFFFKQWAGVRPRELGHLLDGVAYRELPPEDNG